MRLINFAATQDGTLTEIPFFTTETVGEQWCSIPPSPYSGTKSVGIYEFDTPLSQIRHRMLICEPGSPIPLKPATKYAVRPDWMWIPSGGANPTGNLLGDMRVPPFMLMISDEPNYYSECKVVNDFNQITLENAFISGDLATVLMIPNISGNTKLQIAGFHTAATPRTLNIYPVYVTGLLAVTDTAAVQSFPWPNFADGNLTTFELVGDGAPVYFLIEVEKDPLDSFDTTGSERYTFGYCFGIRE